VSAFQQTCYRTSYGEPIVGAPVPNVDARTLGHEYLEALARPALAECLNEENGARIDRTGFLLGVSDSLPKDEATALLRALAKSHGLEEGKSILAVVPDGELSVVQGLALAADWIAKGLADRCIVGGVHSYLTRPALRELERRSWLKTSRNTDGAVPGEAACFVVVRREGDPRAQRGGLGLVVRGLGRADPGRQSSRRGDGLTQALRTALASGGVAAHDVAFRPSNQTGQGVCALESAIAAMRIFRDPGPYPPAWLPATSIGMIGAPVGVLLLGWAAAGFAKNYAPGKVALCELTSVDGTQGALLATAG
jgi:3-oxoacyl-[acyl-carrier-protein] synthase-1